MRKIIYFTLTIMVAFSLAHAKGVIDKVVLSKPGIIGQMVTMDVNKVELPLFNDGRTANEAAYYPAGSGKSFLFAGGIGCSGYVNGDLRTAWVIAASRIGEFQAGKWGMDPNDAKAKFYIVSKDDNFGSQAYIDWADAVEVGADFQDLDGNGLYDPNIDRPDILGDKTIWTVYNDGTGTNERARLQTDPMGIEVHQSVFGFNRGDALGDVLYLRYRVINQTDEDIDDFIFSAVMDPDLGDYRDDLIGCDTTLSLGFIYNDGDDPTYGSNPPAFGVDFFQGAVVESAGDTAFLYRGPYFGIDTVLDSKNLGMTSFMYYIQSHPTIGDPNIGIEARRYQEGGKDREGHPIDPVNFGFGTGADESTNPLFLYSGDPVTGEGWLDDPPDDKRFLVNSGPFQLAKHDTQDIVLAYVVSQGSDALNSVTLLKEEDVIAQTAYDANFYVAGPPPPPKYSIRTFDNKFEILLDMKDWMSYDVVDKLLNRQQFQGFMIYQYNSNSISEKISGIENAKMITAYDLDDQYGNLLEDSKIGERILLWEGLNNLDPNLFTDENSQYYSITIDKDAFNNDDKLINGKTYYFSIVPFSIDINHIEPNERTSDVQDDWIFTGSGGFLNTSSTSGFFTVIPGSSELQPFEGFSSQQSSDIIKHISGKSEGWVSIDVVDRDELVLNDYTIEFFGDGNYWNLINLDLDSVIVDSVTSQGYDGTEWNFPIADGVSVKVFNKCDSVASVDTSGFVYLLGRPNSGFPGSHYGSGVDYAKYVKPEFAPLVKREDYFPVKVVFDTTESSRAYVWRNQNYSSFSGLRPSYISAYDMSNESEPRQVNVIYHTPSGDLDLKSGNVNFIYITMSDYDTSGVYPDSINNKVRDAYIVLNLEYAPTSDTTFYEQKAGVMDMLITPTYVNADNDVYEFSTDIFMEDMSLGEKEKLLESVKVVPNPYFGYSAYETSYDAPRLRFTHLDKQAKIRIFNLAGQLVKTIEKNDNTNEIYWDLRNEDGLKVASGMYIAHIEVSGVGEKIIKFGVVQREERIDRY